MAHHDVDGSGAALVGGELRDVTECSGPAGLDAVALIVTGQLDRLKTGLVASEVSMLLVGPRAARLLDVVAVTPGLRVAAVTRALDDVRMGAANHPGVAWTAGALDRYPNARSHHLIVALGGPQALLSPDSQGWSTDRLITELGAHLAPGGLLLVDVVNGLGLDRLLDIGSPSRRSDAEWWVGMPGLDERGRWVHELGRLGRSSADGDRVSNRGGLVVVETYAEWPSTGSPVTLVSVGALADTSTAALAAHMTVRHTGVGDVPSLVDRRRAVADVFAAGAAHTLAPGWLVAFSRAPTGDAAGRLPALVVAEPEVPGTPGLRLVVSAPGEEAHAVGAAPSTSAGTGPLSRDVQRVPRPGPTLAERLRTRLRLGDRDGARVLLAAYAGWLATLDPAQRAVAVTTNVAVKDAATSDGPLEWWVIDDSWVVSGPGELAAEDVDAVLWVSLDDVATVIMVTADGHPFGPGASRSELRTELLVLAGVSVDQIAPGHAHAVTELLASNRLTVRSDVAWRGGFDDKPVPGADAGYRTLQQRVVELGDALTEQARRAAWLEGTLRARDRDVKLLERSVDVEASAAYRALRQLARPVPALRRRARQTLDRARRRE